MATNLHSLTISLTCILLLLLSVYTSNALPAAKKECKVDKVGLISCLPCISGDHPNPNPSPDCCTALSNADLPCLCSYKNSPDLKKLGIRMELAVKLPQKCHLTVPKECY